MKVAISLPDPVFQAAEGLSRRLKKPRSRLYAEAIARYVESHDAVGIREKLDAVYAVEKSALDPAVARAQAKVLKREAW